MLQTHFKTIFLVTFTLLASSCNKQKSLQKHILTKTESITKDFVTFGPRPANSKSHAAVQNYIETYLKSYGIALNKQNFTASTPVGDVSMSNLMYTAYEYKPKYPSVLLAAHYDSKYMPGKNFLGVNDAASSVALILALTPLIKKLSLPYNVKVVFFDGEEAFERWSDQDSLYGSKRYANDKAGSENIAYGIVVDMISDKNLKLVRSHASDPALLKLLEQVLQSFKWQDLLDKQVSFIEDDHIPLVRAGIPTLHLMDFTYGSSSSPGKFWHTEDDTLDNISFENTAKVGQIILDLLKNIPVKTK